MRMLATDAAARVPAPRSGSLVRVRAFGCAARGGAIGSPRVKMPTGPSPRDCGLVEVVRLMTGDVRARHQHSPQANDSIAKMGEPLDKLIRTYVLIVGLEAPWAPSRPEWMP